MSWFSLLAKKIVKLCPDQYKNPLCKINIWSCIGFNKLLLNFLISNFYATFWSWINILDIFHRPWLCRLQKMALTLIPECFLVWVICPRVRRSLKVNFLKEASLVFIFWCLASLWNNNLFLWWLSLLEMFSPSCSVVTVGDHNL